MIKPKRTAAEQVEDEAARRALNPTGSRQTISDSQAESEFQENHKRLKADRLAREAKLKAKGEMITNVLPSIFTIEAGGTPTLVFEAQNLRSAHELCHEQWLKSDLAEAKANGVPLWDGKAKLRARMALPDESALFAEAKTNGEPSDGLVLVYLVELDGEAADEESVGPGEFPPAPT